MDIEKRKRTKKRCTLEWKKKNIKAYLLEFNMNKENDRAMYEYVKSHDNIRKWLKSLIQKDWDNH